MASLNLSHIRGNPAFAEFPLTRPVRPSLSSPVSRVGFRVLGQAQPSSSEPDLSVTVNGLHMPNPFVIGSGPPGTNYTVMKRAFDEGWGAVIAKTVSCSYFFFSSMPFVFQFHHILPPVHGCLPSKWISVKLLIHIFGT